MNNPMISAALLIDAGNTRTKWAIAALQTGMPPLPGQWLEHGLTDKQANITLAAAWRTAIERHQTQYQITRILISNVAGPAIAEALSATLSAAGLHALQPEFFVSQPRSGGIINNYDHPDRLGCDRFASLIGARHRYPGKPLLIVTSGTATTIDALSADGLFSGGLILPGLATMAGSLSSDTAQLAALMQSAEQRPDTALSAPFATQTYGGIMNGCLIAHIGAILHAHSLWEATCGEPVLCILSGGGARYIAPELPVDAEQIDSLVLLGLHTSLLIESC